MFCRFPSFIFGVCAVALFLCTPFPAHAQAVGPRGQAITVGDAAYLLAPAQMIASAEVDEIFINPQGRYVLITQREAALPPASLTKKADTEASALLLYDAKLRKTTTLWRRRAGGKPYDFSVMQWLTQSNCALVTVINDPEAEDPSLTVWFFNFDQSKTARTVLTTGPDAEGLAFYQSSLKPIFALEEGGRIYMGGAPNGVFGPPLVIPRRTSYVVETWNSAGNALYFSLTNPKASEDEWYEWNGKTPNPMLLKAKPVEVFSEPTTPPVFPITLRTGTITIPAAPDKNALPIVLHPLFLEAADQKSAASHENKNDAPRSVLLAPDADEFHLMPDLSAILYQSGGALYAVPLVRVSAAEYAALQKAAASPPAKKGTTP